MSRARVLYFSNWRGKLAIFLSEGTVSINANAVPDSSKFLGV